MGGPVRTDGVPPIVEVAVCLGVGATRFSGCGRRSWHVGNVPHGADDLDVEHVSNVLAAVSALGCLGADLRISFVGIRA